MKEKMPRIAGSKANWVQKKCPMYEYMPDPFYWYNPRAVAGCSIGSFPLDWFDAESFKKPNIFNLSSNPKRYKKNTNPKFGGNGSGNGLKSTKVCDNVTNTKSRDDKSGNASEKSRVCKTIVDTKFHRLGSGNVLRKSRESRTVSDNQLHADGDSNGSGKPRVCEAAITKFHGDGLRKPRVCKTTVITKFHGDGLRKPRVRKTITNTQRHGDGPANVSQKSKIIKRIPNTRRLAGGSGNVSERNRLRRRTINRNSSYLNGCPSLENGCHTSRHCASNPLNNPRSGVQVIQAVLRHRKKKKKGVLPSKQKVEEKVLLRSAEIVEGSRTAVSLLERRRDDASTETHIASSSRTGQSGQHAGSDSYSKKRIALEILFLFLIGGLLSFTLLPYFESALQPYVSRFCHSQNPSKIRMPPNPRVHMHWFDCSLYK